MKLTIKAAFRTLVTGAATTGGYRPALPGHRLLRQRGAALLRQPTGAGTLRRERGTVGTGAQIEEGGGYKKRGQEWKVWGNMQGSTGV